jgi:hypothetical protein
MDGSVRWITKAGQCGFIPRADLIAAGESRVYGLYQSDGTLRSCNLEDGTTRKVVLDSDIAYHVCYNAAQNKSGYLDVDTLFTKSSEAQGSRVLYLGHYKVHTDTLTVVSSSTTALTGDNLDEGPEFHPVTLENNVLVLSHHDKSNLILVDLNHGTYKLSANSPTTHAYIHPQTIMWDRTNDYPYLFCQQHYWIVHSFTHCLLYDLQNNAWVENDTYDCNSGAVSVPLWYKGTDGKVRFIYTGNSGEYELDGTDYSKYNLVYADNDDVADEASGMGGAGYSSGGSSNVLLHVLGITADSTLTCVTSSVAKTQETFAYNAACDLIETNNLLGSPSKISNVTLPIAINAESWRNQAFGVIALLEKDWTYRLPVVTYPYSSTTGLGTMNIAKISLSEEIEPNPYGVVIVPS